MGKDGLGDDENQSRLKESCSIDDHRSQCVALGQLKMDLPLRTSVKSRKKLKTNEN
jgi:hypothetical protein